MQFSSANQSNECKKKIAKLIQSKTADKWIRGVGEKVQNKNRCTLQHIRRLIWMQNETLAMNTQMTVKSQYTRRALFSLLCTHIHRWVHSFNFVSYLICWNYFMHVKRLWANCYHQMQVKPSPLHFKYAFNNVKRISPLRLT